MYLFIYLLWGIVIILKWTVVNKTNIHSKQVEEQNKIKTSCAILRRWKWIIHTITSFLIQLHSNDSYNIDFLHNEEIRIKTKDSYSSSLIIKRGKENAVFETDQIVLFIYYQAQGQGNFRKTTEIMTA